MEAHPHGSIHSGSPALSGYLGGTPQHYNPTGAVSDWLAPIGHTETVPIPTYFEQVDFADSRLIKDVFKDLWFLHYSPPNITSNGAATAAAANLFDKPSTMKLVKFGNDFYNCVAQGYRSNVTMIDMIRLHTRNILAIKRVFIDPSAAALIVQVATSCAQMRTNTVALHGPTMMNHTQVTGSSSSSSAVFEVHPLTVHDPTLSEQTRNALDVQTFTNYCGGPYDAVLYRIVNDVACGLKILHREAALVGMPDEPSETALQPRSIDNKSVYVCQAFGHRQDIMLQDMLRLYGLYPNYIADVSYNFTAEPYNKNQQIASGALQVVISAKETAPIALPTFYSFSGTKNAATNNNHQQLFAASMNFHASAVGAEVQRQTVQHAFYVPQPCINSSHIAGEKQSAAQELRLLNGNSSYPYEAVQAVAAQGKRKRDEIQEVAVDEVVHKALPQPLTLSQVLQVTSSIASAPLPPPPPQAILPEMHIQSNESAPDSIEAIIAQQQQQQQQQSTLIHNGTTTTTTTATAATTSNNLAITTVVTPVAAATAQTPQLESVSTLTPSQAPVQSETRPSKLRRFWNFLAGFSS